MKTIIAIFAAILILDNWGFNMTTIIAGLGVGGIAVALAAQQTIANVFGGVSVIGDAPLSWSANAQRWYVKMLISRVSDSYS